MRPVNKGSAPNKMYKKYQDAEPDLEKRIGPYCSFCEMPINHVPEVEHREAKVAGGDLLKWENLLLSCKYCNTRKSKIVKKGDAQYYIWPDEDDTFHAYRYDTDIPKLNEEYFTRNKNADRVKAQKLFNLLKLDNVPTKVSDKDRRFFLRNETKNYAVECKKTLKNMSSDSDKKACLKVMEYLAVSSGFFSIWMEIFKDDLEVKNMLILAFKGTKSEYCK